MLCDECNAAFAEHPAMMVFLDMQDHAYRRRHAATVLVSLSRKRKRKKP